MKKSLTIISLIFLVLLLSGCTEVNEPISPDSTGIWNQFFVYPLSWLIIKIAHLFGGTWGYGLSIIIVTIIIRTAILPLMIHQMKSMKMMQQMQPEIEKLKQKYTSKDAVTQRKLQEEQMLLMQKLGVNPLAGCLPILIQMPILIAFYHAIVRTKEIQAHSFLWFELASPDPFFILPIIAASTTFLQQRITMAGNPNQNPQTAMLMWMMPFMILAFSLFVPAALPLYWIVGNIFSIVQAKFIKTPEINVQTASGRPGGKKK
ncbi:YidC family membrane integrase SpoIIIJ [Bacillus kwashiorkori]|uniref:YidC family membrane integrase SpoIIIJ n=1 Tax=Bacillus kwashiorkori TaxID=1522318 RepID=UPI000784C12B|nr:YidC family membrane integrase SpoIIIJ [Bacillus kwashiorkori]